MIALMAFAAVALATLAVGRPRENHVRRRALGTSAHGIDVAGVSTGVQGSLVSRILLPLATRVGRRLASLLPRQLLRQSDHLLKAANTPWSLPTFMGLTALSAGFGFLFVLYLFLVLGLNGRLIATLGAVIVPLAASMPALRVRGLARRRQQAITRALPDAMDLLVTSVGAGLGVDAAFALVAEKTQGPLSETLALYLRQVGLGRPRSEALAYVADLTGVPDLVHVAASVNQGMALGTPIGDVLRQQAEELRMARRQRAQIAAQRAPVLMTIPLALCFLPAAAAVVIVPSIMNFVRFMGEIGN